MIATPILALALVFAPEPEPAELPVDIGPQASDRFEDYVTCMADQSYSRRLDRRPTALLAAEVRSECAGSKARAAEALTASYRRDPTLLHPGEEPAVKAAGLLQTWDVRLEWVLDRFRQLRDEE
jgi:hypothetical protein